MSWVLILTFLAVGFVWGMAFESRRRAGAFQTSAGDRGVRDARR